MAIKRTAPQMTQELQTTSQMVYRLKTKGEPPTTPAAKLPTSPASNVFGISSKWLYWDLLRTVVATGIILIILGVVKYQGWLN